jgi:hypothetical protein
MDPAQPVPAVTWMSSGACVPPEHHATAAKSWTTNAATPFGTGEVDVTTHDGADRYVFIRPAKTPRKGG